MFGLEHQKKAKRTEEFEFDLEKDLKNLAKHKEMKEKIQKRIQSLKEILRSGEKKEFFDKYGVLLHAYTSLLKVMSRFNPK